MTPEVAPRQIAWVLRRTWILAQKWILAALLVASGALSAVLFMDGARREDARKLAECAEVKRECRQIVTTCINSLP